MRAESTLPINEGIITRYSVGMKRVFVASLRYTLNNEVQKMCKNCELLYLNNNNTQDIVLKSFLLQNKKILKIIILSNKIYYKLPYKTFFAKALLHYLPS